MKVVWLFPPALEGGFPNISQYRFYKKMPIRASIIYPYLAASGVTLLKANGVDVVFMDCPTMDLDWVDVLGEVEEADLVVLEARTPQINYIRDVCKILQRDPFRCKILLYGDHASWDPKPNRPYCDYIVKGGNYDVGVWNIAFHLKEGLTLKQGIYPCRVPPLDDLPFVDRDFVPWNLYYEAWKHREKFFWIMSMRGCYYKCIFCSWVGTFWDHRINYRSPSNVADEYSMLYERYGECEVLDDADVFDTGWGVKFARELLNRGLGDGRILWACQTHPNMIYNLPDLRLLRESGLRTVKLGVESLNQKTLDLLKKGTTVTQVEKAISLLKQAEIMVHANLMVGFPWEGRKEAYHTIQAIKKLDPNQAQFSLLIPYPNTELYDLAKSNDWLLVEEGDWNGFDASRPMLKMQGLTSEEIVQLYKDHWSKFYFNPKYVWNHVKKVRHWEGVKQLYRGFKSIYFGHMKAVD